MYDRGGQVETHSCNLSELAISSDTAYLQDEEIESTNAQLQKETLKDITKDISPDSDPDAEDFEFLKAKLNAFCSNDEAMKRNGAWDYYNGGNYRLPRTPHQNNFQAFRSPNYGMGPRQRFNPPDPRFQQNPYIPMRQRFPRYNARMQGEKKTLYILRGAPGSGKSTLARQLAGKCLKMSYYTIN